MHFPPLGLPIRATAPVRQESSFTPSRRRCWGRPVRDRHRHPGADQDWATTGRARSCAVPATWRSCTGGSKRSNSSTVSGAVCGASPKRSSASGRRRRVSIPLVIRLTVVSWPAISSRTAVVISSTRDIRPSGPSSVIHAERMSSPGWWRCSSISPARYCPRSRRACCAERRCSAASWPGLRPATTASTRARKRGSSCLGTPR